MEIGGVGKRRGRSGLKLVVPILSFFLLPSFRINPLNDFLSAPLRLCGSIINTGIQGATP
jgi:hypothetical protein